MSGKRCALLCVGVLWLFWLSGCGGSSKPIGVAVAASATTVDGTNTLTMTATVTNDKNAAGVKWSMSGAGSLSNTSTTSATYTAPAATSTAQTATVTATSLADSSKTGSVTLTVAAQPTVATTSTDLMGAVGTAFSITLKGSGGIPPYKNWAVSTSGSALPSCLTLNPSMGVIAAASGTAPLASCAGTYSNLIFTYTDSGTPNALTLTITAAPAISFTGTVPATSTYGVAYAGSAAATGGAGPLTYSISAGALPADLSLNQSTGAIAGTPSKAADVGTFNFTVKAADAFGDEATQSYQIVVSYSAVSITTSATLPVGYVGSSYSGTTLAATGGNGGPYTWSWAAASGSSLPAGLALSPAGFVNGTPTTAGTYSVVVTATDSASNAGHATLSVAVKPGVSVTTASLPTGYTGSAYSSTLAATGGVGTPYTWTWAAASGSSLPAGLTLSPAGAVGGTPTTTGTFSVVVTAADSISNKGSATLSLVVQAGVSVTTSSLPPGYQGTVYPGATLAATGGAGTPYTWTWAAASGSSLPAGLTLSSAGVIGGTPTAAGTFNVVVTAADSISNSGSATLSLKVEAALAVSSPTTLPGATVNEAYSLQLAATGGSEIGYSWSTDAAGSTSLGTLNLSLSSGGLVTGTPTSSGTANFTVTVKDSENHTATANLSVTAYSTLTITTTTLPVTYAGANYSQILDAAGGTGTGYAWSATASNLGTYGLSLSAGGLVSGIPTQSGTASFTANVKDSANHTATQALTITIYGALSLPAPNPASLPSNGYTGVAYTGEIDATGGSGNFSWQVTGLSDGLSATPGAGRVTISGTPTSQATVTFSVMLTDTTTNASVTQNGYTITVSNPTPVALPAASPNPLPDATVNQSYSGAINASGGVPPYTWSINGTSVGGSGVSLGNGTLAASTTGGSALSINGTPGTSGTVTLTSVKVEDSLHTNATQTYSITVNSAGQNVTGQVFLNTCSGQKSPPTITLSINTNPVKTATTDNNGNYSFAGIPNGAYTITPSISGPSSVFYPAKIDVNVNNADLNNENFNVSLGYTVAGTVSYSGSQSGRVYLILNNNQCAGGGNAPGTSISAPGSFTINGVTPGGYTLEAMMDAAGYGAPNANDPSGSASVTVSLSNVTDANVSMSDPSAITLTTGPTINMVSPAEGAVAIPYQPIKNNNGVEMATSYTVQWSTSSTFTSTAGSKTFPANGDSTDVWILTGLTDGQTYYFRARGTAGSSNSPWSIYGGGTPKAVTIGTPTSGNTISGTVTFTGTATGPLMVGFYSQTSGVYVDVIQNPVSPQAYTVYVPNGSDYIFFGIIDQNNDGIVDSGDITNVTAKQPGTVAITGNSTMNLTLPNAASTAVISTTYWQQTNGSNTSTGYNINLNVREGNKLPVAVQLTSGPNVISPLDLSVCTDCGTPQFQYYVSMDGATPSVGDAYVFHVTYKDGTTEDLTALVTGWNGTSTIVGAGNLATNLSPSGTGSTTPTFTWTDPPGASSYIYQFYLWGNMGNTIWQIPGQNSDSSGFDSSITSITWGTDPTDASNTPSGSLSSGTTYSWQIQIQDSAGNQAQTQVYFTP